MSQVVSRHWSKQAAHNECSRRITGVASPVSGYRSSGWGRLHYRVTKQGFWKPYRVEEISR